MKIITKTISLESFKSRIPGIVPSIQEKWELVHNSTVSEYNSYDQALKAANDYHIKNPKIVNATDFYQCNSYHDILCGLNGNYGLMPSDIEIPQDIVDSITDYTDIYVNVSDNNGGYYDIRQISDDDIRNRAINGTTYYFYYNHNIFSIACDSQTSSLNVDDVLKKSTLHKYLTYSTLKKWFHFFKKYDSLLKSGTNNVKYASALDFYQYEIKNKSEAEYEKYKGYDDTFAARGGNTFFDWVSNNCIPVFMMPKQYINANKASFLYYPQALKLFNWLQIRYYKYNNISDNANRYTFTAEISGDTAKGLEITDEPFISEFFDKQFNDSYLYFTSGKEDSFNTFQINEEDSNIQWPPTSAKLKASGTPEISSGDCCDYNEYIIHGGNQLYYKLKEWLVKVTKIPSATNSASIVIPVMLSTNIDDLGIMTIMSEKHNAKADYTSNLDSSKRMYDATGSTVVYYPMIVNNDNGSYFIDRNAYILREGAKGNIQNEYLESSFNPSDWDDYTVAYINSHKDEFISTATQYAMNRNGQIIHDPNDAKMAIHYPISWFSYGAFLIDGQIYEITRSKYVIYQGKENSLLNNKQFLVRQGADGIYYTKIGNNTYYALKKHGNYYFNFSASTECDSLKDYQCQAMPDGDQKIDILEFKNRVYEVSGDTVEIENNGYTERFKKIDGYSITPSGTVFIRNHNVAYVTPQYDYEMTISGSTDGITDEDKNYFKYNLMGWQKSDIYPVVTSTELQVHYPYETFRCDVVTGHTDSKLDMLRQTRILTDDLGNVMPGYYSAASGSSSIQPYKDCALDLYYHVGNVSDLSKNELLTVDDSVYSQYFDGNILQKMVIYSSVDGKKTDPIVFDNDKESQMTVLEAIKESVSAATSIGNEISKQGDDIPSNHYDIHTYCEFTYYIGAILHERIREDSDGFYDYQGYELASNMNHGVKYTETVELVNDTAIFHMADGNSFPVNYYNFKKKQRRITDNENNVKWIDDAVFESDIILFSENNKGNVIVTKDEFQHKNGFDQLGNSIALPSLRTDDNIGFATVENMNSNIYIDRGISKSFDKHLALQEIKTLDAMVSYKNGGFYNILEN